MALRVKKKPRRVLHTLKERMEQMEERLQEEGCRQCVQCHWWDDPAGGCSLCQASECNICFDEIRYTECQGGDGCIEACCGACRDDNMVPCAAGSEKCSNWICADCEDEYERPCGHTMCRPHYETMYDRVGENCRFCAAERARMLIGILSRAPWRKWAHKDIRTMIGKWVWDQRL